MTQVRPGYLGPAQLSTLIIPWPGHHGVIRGEEVKLPPAALVSQVTPILTHSMNGHLNMLNRPRAATLGEMSSFLQSNMSAGQRYNAKTM